MKRVLKRVQPTLEELHSRAFAPVICYSAGFSQVEKLLSVLVFVLANDIEMGPLTSWAYRLLLVKRPQILDLNLIGRIAGKQGLTEGQTQRVIEQLDVLWFLEMRRAFDLAEKNHGYDDPRYAREDRLERLLQEILRGGSAVDSRVRVSKALERIRRVRSRSRPVFRAAAKHMSARAECVDDAKQRADALAFFAELNAIGSVKSDAQEAKNSRDRDGGPADLGSCREPAFPLLAQQGGGEAGVSRGIMSEVVSGPAGGDR